MRRQVAGHWVGVINFVWGDGVFDDVLLPEWVLVSAVRYALGRSSYVVPSTVGLLRERWGSVDGSVREVILRDVREFVERRGPGDVWPWEDFLGFVATRAA